MTITRESPVTVLPGIGKTRAEYYAKMGVHTLGDLLSHYPRAYENRGDVRLLADARIDGKTSVILTVATEPRTVRLRSHKSFLKFRAFDESGSCEIVYFNQDYLRSTFPIGSTFRFFGKVERHVVQNVNLVLTTLVEKLVNTGNFNHQASPPFKDFLTLSPKSFAICL
jgi:ATP-dependent DNA helicase RecG